jgi:copper chaperone CopZ
LSFSVSKIEAQTLKNILDKAKSGLSKTTGVPLNNQEVGTALKEALELGVGEAVKSLSATDGYHASIYKILLPEEAKKVTNKLKNIPGFTKVEAELVLRINRAAELAAKEAGPIFIQAIKELSFQDAIGILKGNEDAATRYLETKTDTALTSKFLPVIAKALDAVNARTYWREAVTAYNKIPLIQKVNPELDKYVTEKSIDGMFSLVQVKEKKIRTDVSARTSDLLKKVFGSQEKK